MLGEKSFRPLRKAPWTFSTQNPTRAKVAFSAQFRDGAQGSSAPAIGCRAPALFPNARVFPCARGLPSACDFPFERNLPFERGVDGPEERRARVPTPLHDPPRRRVMRFHCVIILTMPRLRIRQVKPGRNGREEMRFHCVIILKTPRLRFGRSSRDVMVGMQWSGCNEILMRNNLA